MAALPTFAYGARPFVTDDARITDPGGCQLESWAKGQNGGRETWLLPACNPFGCLELSAGVGELRPVGAPSTRYTLLQAKTLFRELKPNGCGWGIAMGAVTRRDGDGRHLSSVYADLPFSASFRDDQWLVHANVGFQQEKVPRQTTLAWGVGTEVALSRDLYRYRRNLRRQSVEFLLASRAALLAHAGQGAGGCDKGRRNERGRELVFRWDSTDRRWPF